jgi:hypothetical protein
LSAQHHIPLSNSYQLPIEKEIISKDYSFNTSLKPYYKKQINTITNFDSLLFSNYSIKVDSSKSWFYKKLLQENFIDVNKEDFNLKIDPIVILTLGNEKDNPLNIFRNTRAVKLEGSLGDKITFSSEFYENQARFPNYVKSSIDSTIVVPGQGVKRNFGEGGFDFNWAEGQIAFHPTNKLIMEFGNGKHFIGNGYRSLLLSDNSFNNPYFKTIYTSKNFFYSKIVMSLMHGIFDVNRSNVLYNRKTANIHYFGFFLGNNIQLSFFEANIWANPDTTGKQDFQFGYINPIPIINGFLKKDNSSIGFNLSANLFQTITLYHQSLFDNFNSNYPGRYGSQNGIKYFDAFSIKNLFMQSEFNIAQPYAYAKENPELSYSHYNQALAHPLGANFAEGIFIANYQYQRFGLNLKLIKARMGLDIENTNNGQNIFNSLETYSTDIKNSKMFQGNTTDLTHSDISLSYLVNPKTNLRLKLGFLSRNLSNDFNSEETIYLYFSLESALKNFYYDF